MASIFTRIINGEIPCYRIAEDERFIAFLDVRPLKPGHTLVVPKKEVDYIFDLDPETLSGLTLFAQKVAVAMKEVIECNRIGVAAMGGGGGFLDVRRKLSALGVDTIVDMAGNDQSGLILAWRGGRRIRPDRSHCKGMCALYSPFAESMPRLV